jgi:hypothetical protein
LIVATIFSVAIALLGMAVFMSSFQCQKKTECDRSQKTDRLTYLHSGACDFEIRSAPGEMAAWSERDWIELATCFERDEDYRRATSTAAWGLGYYPSSEALHNVRGYNLIMQEKWDEAVIALRVGLRSVGQPTTGTMQNNLAWAGLFSDDRMTLSEAREHYRDSLDLEPNSCEALHTGMWTEYGIASRSSGSSRDAAMGAYRTLRAEYGSCTNRLRGADEWTAYEIAGTALMDEEMAKLSMIQMFESGERTTPQRFAINRQLMGDAFDVVHRTAPADVETTCSKIAPVRSAMPTCRKAFTGWMARR